MLSYQHEYHAGNHADVLKHAVLVLLIEALKRKSKPFRVLDTHAGSGAYDLTRAEAQRNREHESGITRVLGSGPLPTVLARYAAVVESLNVDGELRRYPGSPLIALSLLRADDHVELFELHPRAFASLERVLGRDRRAHLHRRDGSEGLLAVLPPPERRGVVLIDPSYETRNDFERVLDVLPAALRRWSNGVFAVWYPLIRRAEAGAFVRRLLALELPDQYRVELAIRRPGDPGLRGSGLVIANLPYGVDSQLEALVPWLHRRLAPGGEGGWRAGRPPP